MVNNAAVSPGDHVCLPMGCPREHEDFIVEYVRDGLRRGERCLVASDPEPLDAIASKLHAAGAPVARLQDTGALVLTHRDEIYRPHGEFDMRATLEGWVAAARSARTAGFTGFRGVAGPPWSAEDPAQRAQVVAYEREVDRLVREHRLTALCLYEQTELDVESALGLLSSHPLAVVGQRVYQNPFWGEPGDVPASDPVSCLLAHLIWRQERDAELAVMKAALVREANARALEAERLRERDDLRARALELRNALLGTVSRQVRAPLAPLREALHGLAATAASGRGVDADAVERTREELDRLERLADQLARLTAFMDSEVTIEEGPGDLVPLVQSTFERWVAERARGRDVLVRFAAPLELHGIWDRGRVTLVIEQLLNAAFEHGWGTPIELTVEDLGVRARVVVAYADMELSAARPLEARASDALVAQAHDRLSLAIWVPREAARAMGGSLGVSAWPTGRVSFTFDLPLRRALRRG